MQLEFKPADIKHSSFRTMAQHVRRAMLPNNHTVFKKSFAEGTWTLCCPCVCAAARSDIVWPAALDGNQILDFYWTDPIDAMIRSVAKLQYKDKLYTTFKPGMSIAHPMVRAFDKANSGMVFQSAYLLDSNSSPLLALFYADASFSGQSMSHHPIYSMLLYRLSVFFMFYNLCILLQCVC
jgi:hypothetical protein